MEPELLEQHKQMYRDLYLGKDKENPSITTRLYDAEKTLEKMTSRDQRFFWLIVTTLGAVLLNLLGIHR